jgi:SAM-dependent methyltransferase
VLDVSYDAELYLRLAHQAGGAVLELAVGSGRLAIPLALAGHRVVGVDHDSAMLERARAAWQRSRGPVERERLSVHEGDFMSFRCAERFSLAFIAVNTFLLAEDDAARLRSWNHEGAPAPGGWRRGEHPDGTSL